MQDGRKRKRQDFEIPPRWLNCPRKGNKLDRFIPFKTPLDRSYDDQVPEAKRFNPEMMLEFYKDNLGLWIDLTNTTRFYNRAAVEAQDVKYVKLQCRGHGACPTEEQARTFISLIENFAHLHPDKIVGVHCTHGFNRTGFLIISYLVEALSWSLELAINAFSRVRPPGIYKQDYLQELYRRYDDVGDTPPAPPLPDWCLEEDEKSDEEAEEETYHAKNSNRPSKKRKKTRENNFKKNPTFMAGIPGVSTVEDSDKVTAIQRKIQKMCEWRGRSGFPGSQPVSMDRSNINFLSEMPYMVSWKADGTRYMMLIDGEDEIYFIDRDNSVFQITGLKFLQRKDLTKHLYSTLVDGEMIIDKVNGIDVPRYLIYDIIMFMDLEVGKTPFKRRLHCIRMELITPRQEAMKRGLIIRDREPFSVRIKEFWDATYAERLLDDKFTQQLPHEIDGLIFQPSNQTYVVGTCPQVLKWKPQEMNSVDFKLVVSKENREGMLQTSIGLLYCGGLDRHFSEIKVTKALKAYHNKIIECKLENNEWKFMRERTDKSFPNAYKTVMSIMNSIKAPVTKDFLINFISQHGWQKDRELMPPPPSSTPHPT